MGSMTVLHRKQQLRELLRTAETNQKLLVLVFMSSWSEPWKLMDTILDSIASRSKADAEFYTLDVDVFPQFAQTLGVEALPTVVLMRQGVVVDRIVGLGIGDQVESSIQTNKITEIQVTRADTDVPSPRFGRPLPQSLTNRVTQAGKTVVNKVGNTLKKGTRVGATAGETLATRNGDVNQPNA